MVLLGSLWAWHALGGNWWVFAATVLLPDLSMLGYLASPRLGARLYNLVHSYPLAALALVLGTVLPNPLLVFAGILLLAHIGWDRSLGYGLKLASGFKDSHLGRLGQ